jgi:hypothetical protein
VREPAFDAGVVVVVEAAVMVIFFVEVLALYEPFAAMVSFTLQVPEDLVVILVPLMLQLPETDQVFLPDELVETRVVAVTVEEAARVLVFHVIFGDVARGSAAPWATGPLATSAETRQERATAARRRF